METGSETEKMESMDCFRRNGPAVDIDATCQPQRLNRLMDGTMRWNRHRLEMVLLEKGRLCVRSYYTDADLTDIRHTEDQ